MIELPVVHTLLMVTTEVKKLQVETNTSLFWIFRQLSELCFFLFPQRRIHSISMRKPLPSTRRRMDRKMERRRRRRVERRRRRRTSPERRAIRSPNLKARRRKEKEKRLRETRILLRKTKRRIKKTEDRRQERRKI